MFMNSLDQFDSQCIVFWLFRPILLDFLHLFVVFFVLVIMLFWFKIKLNLHKLSNHLNFQGWTISWFHYFCNHHHFIFHFFHLFQELFVLSFTRRRTFFLFGWEFCFFLWSFYISCSCLRNISGSWDFLRWYLSRFLFFWRRNLFFWDNLTSSIISFRNYIFLGEPEFRIYSSSSFFCKIIIASVTAVQVVVSL